MNRCFYVFPSGNLGFDDIKYEISLDDIEALALFASTLKPFPDLTVALGKISALEAYYQHNTNDLSDSFKKLVSGGMGREILCLTVELVDLEKKFRRDGISDEKLIQLYNKLSQAYKKKIEVNNNIYGDEKKIEL